ncbi:MAG: putative zinc-binding peptidase [Caldilineaceae bacterium]
MKLFKCQNCGQLLYFENTKCERCGHALGYLWERAALVTLTPAQNGQWFIAAAPATAYTYCANVQYGSCNWLIAGDSDDTLCLACQLNHTIPDLSQPMNLTRWQKLEVAKHRLVYSLLRLQLPVVSKEHNETWGLEFEFLADDNSPNGQVVPVTTGHKDGVITINIAEADDAKRESARQSLAEPYRTLLGHFRHEIAHYYWMLFAQSPSWLQEFRAVFGDERKNYADALADHYANPQTDNWQASFVSAYAATHPWEDWAETWAHYLHIVDTLETAHAFGLQIEPAVDVDQTLSTSVEFDPYRPHHFEDLIATWLPLTFAVNSLNRSMGQPDLYPFVLTPTVMKKLTFIHNRIGSSDDIVQMRNGFADDLHTIPT